MKNGCRSIYSHYLSSQKGQSLGEYSIILGLVSLIAIPALLLLGQQGQQTLNQVNQNQTQFDSLTALIGPNSQSANTTGIAGGNNPNFKTSVTTVSFTPTLSVNLSQDPKSNEILMQDSRTTTSVEGSTVFETIASKFDTLAEGNISQEQKEKIQQIAQNTRDQANALKYFEQLKAQMGSNTVNPLTLDSATGKPSTTLPPNFNPETALKWLSILKNSNVTSQNLTKDLFNSNPISPLDPKGLNSLQVNASFMDAFINSNILAAPNLAMIKKLIPISSTPSSLISTIDSFNANKTLSAFNFNAMAFNLSKIWAPAVATK
ncbi:MAG: hypothetical protein K2X66_04390 [Cyanobacteria bacterium]|nr:hypothetical protein [Cyanobacteriota bacterium]